ncbi:MAG TPA: DUF6173 family protein [Ramlibacter sp.]
MSDELEPPLTDEAICRLSTVVGPLPDHVPQPGDHAGNPARWMFERLATYIKQFESRLDEEHEIGARLVSFGANLSFHIEDMGYFGPDMIVFYGKNEKGEPVQLIQHTSQLSVLLVAVRKQDARPRRIGFILDEKEPAIVPAEAQTLSKSV